MSTDCQCDYRNMTGEPCWRARRTRDRVRLIVDAADIEIGDIIDDHHVYDIAPSTAAPDHIMVAVGRNGAASAYRFEITEQIEVLR